MSGRIRTIKPEWLEDEKLLACSCQARLLSVALILLADDYGRGRAHPGYIGSHVFPIPGDYALTGDSLSELVGIGFVSLYSVRGQRYFEIRNWGKHQRVDKPGKPHVPPPDEGTVDQPAEQQSKAVYFILGSSTGLIKIGESIDPVARMVELSRCGSESLQLLAVVANGSRTERELHEKLSASRVHGEWFRPSQEVLAELESVGGTIDNPIATSGYDGKIRRTESFENDSRTVPESFAPDLRPVPVPTTHDLERQKSKKRRPKSQSTDSKKLTLCPDRSEIELSEATIARATNLGVDPELHFRDMFDWSHAGNNKKADWNATLRTFMNREPGKHRVQRQLPSQTSLALRPGGGKPGQTLHPDGYWYYPLSAETAQ